MWEPVALCCFTRRTGCIVLGALELIGAILGFIVFTFAFTLVEHTMTNIVCKNETLSKLGTDCDGLTNAVYGVMVFYMICASIQGLCAAMMVYGVLKDKPTLIIPFMIKNTIVIALNIIFCSAVVAFLCVFNFFLVIPYVYCYGAMIFMWTYFLLTVRAYYYELKHGKSVDHHRLTEHCQVENCHTGM
ncbi:uncharacterized protein LOC123516299 isoform X2 [Portunus trituberculatus]|nr:uncharacterized protein LOC123516299 isoform X2 [Portunus trituberculatus]